MGTEQPGATLTAGGTLTTVRAISASVTLSTTVGFPVRTPFSLAFLLTGEAGLAPVTMTVEFITIGSMPATAGGTVE